MILKKNSKDLNANIFCQAHKSSRVMHAEAGEEGKTFFLLLLFLEFLDDLIWKGPVPRSGEEKKK